jgi:hypothetical protein
MNATKRHRPPVKKGTLHDERVHIPEMRDMVVKATIRYQTKGSLGKVRNRKAEKIEAVKVEGGGEYVFVTEVNKEGLVHVV